MSMAGRIKEELSEAAIYEQLAEECTELAHACLKKARKLRGENPTPLQEYDIDCKIIEEYTDVQLVSKLLGIDIDHGLYCKKFDRWYERLVLAPKIKLADYPLQGQ